MGLRKLCFLGDLSEASQDNIVIDDIIELLDIALSNVNWLLVMLVYEVLDTIDGILS